LQPAEYIKFGHVSEKTEGYAFGIMVVEMLANIDCRQASALVDEHELNTLPQALKQMADAGGWPAIISDVLSKVQGRHHMHSRNQNTHHAGGGAAASGGIVGVESAS
jgi:hypothetical protein